MRNNVLLAISKFGTLLVDRRFWAWVISMGVVIGFVPATADAKALSDQTVSAILMILQGATMLLGMLALVYSWTKRPPSGLDYKKLPTELEELIPILTDLMFKKDAE